MIETGCLECGTDLVYSADPVEVTCTRCGGTFKARIYCPRGHYVCDRCHREAAGREILGLMAASSSTDPLALLEEGFRLPSVKLHGPEHHSLVPAALTAAWANLRGLDPGRKESLVAEAIERGGQIPGGSCGTLGACGAAVGAGIAASVITRATPLSRGEWRFANLSSARALEAVGRLGGPRCCKRASRLALLSAISFLEKGLQVSFGREVPRRQACHFAADNRECILGSCPFYESGGEEDAHTHRPRPL